MNGNVSKYYRLWAESTDFNKYLSTCLVFLIIQAGLFHLISAGFPDFHQGNMLHSAVFWLSLSNVAFFGAACVIIAKCSPRFGGYLVFTMVYGLLFNRLLPIKIFSFGEMIALTFCIGLYLDRGYNVHRDMAHVYSGLFGGWIFGTIVSGIIFWTNIPDFGYKLVIGGFLFVISGSIGVHFMTSFFKSYRPVEVRARVTRPEKT